MKRKLKLNMSIRNFDKGAIITVDCDDDGAPLDLAWRRRVKDSDIDNCVEWVDEAKAVAPKGDGSLKSPKRSKENVNDHN